jgi:hypothetical protein
MMKKTDMLYALAEEDPRGDLDTSEVGSDDKDDADPNREEREEDAEKEEEED